MKNIFSKEKLYSINGRIGQYELTTINDKQHCFFMDDTAQYEYFDTSSTIFEISRPI